MKVSVLMPCLNEASTLAACIEEAFDGLREAGLAGEVIVADNGSDDDSVAIAVSMGARVVSVPRRGYGSALSAGVASSRGEYVVMGDADGSYDFTSVGAFVEKLRSGYDLVMGNRFSGGIDEGAMPFLNKWLGNPVLSSVGRFLFRSGIGDFHCGLRGFRRDAIERLNLQTSGMEFASEMVIKASVNRLRVAEIPVRLRKDGRDRRPHLRPWRDGWRHLRFMLLFSPRWLFLVPGSVLFFAGVAVAAWLLPGPRMVAGVGFDIHTLLIGCLLSLLGYQSVLFAVFSKVFAIRVGFHPPHRALNRLFRFLNLEVGLAAGALMTLAGCAGLVVAAWSWRQAGFGALDPMVTMREVIPASTLVALGVQTVFASFFLSILGIDQRTAEAEVLRR